MSSRSVTWISLLSDCLLRTLVLGLGFAFLVAVVTLTVASGQSKPPRKNMRQSGPSRSYSGMITDSYCNARHDKNRSLSSAECVHMCVRDGAKYVLVNGDSTYILSGREDELARVAGQRARVGGALDGDTLQVDWVSAQ